MSGQLMAKPRVGLTCLTISFEEMRRIALHHQVQIHGNSMKIAKSFRSYNDRWTIAFGTSKLRII